MAPSNVNRRDAFSLLGCLIWAARKQWPQNPECAQKAINCRFSGLKKALRRPGSTIFQWHIACFRDRRVWQLGFRLERVPGPRAAARERNFRVHGGTKAREASIARIGIAGSCQSSNSLPTARIENYETSIVIRCRFRYRPLYHHSGLRRAEEGIQYRLVDLRR